MQSDQWLSCGGPLQAVGWDLNAVLGRILRLCVSSNRKCCDCFVRLPWCRGRTCSNLPCLLIWSGRWRCIECLKGIINLIVAVQGADPFGFRLFGGQRSFIEFCVGPPAFACPGHWPSDLTTLEAKVLPHDILCKMLTTLILSAYPGHAPHSQPSLWPVFPCALC